MLGKKIKKIADKLPLKPFQIAEKMGISTTTLYTLYKKDSIESKHLKKFSEISNVPLSELLELKSEIPKNEDAKILKDEIYFLMKEILEVRRELSKTKDIVIQLQGDELSNLRGANISLGKDKMYSESEFVNDTKIVQMPIKLDTNLNTSLLAQG